MSKGAIDAVRSIYDRRFDAEARRRKALVWRVLVEDFLQRWVRPEDAVLDLGCGFGEFLNHVKSSRRIGVDLNPEAGSYLARGRNSTMGTPRPSP